MAVTWSQLTSIGSRVWKGVRLSTDGSKMLAIGNYTNIYTSTDGGNNWNARGASRQWEDITQSNDGLKLAAVCAYNNQSVYTSTDGGVNWTEQYNSSTTSLIRIASSLDGTKIYAARTEAPGIRLSTDSGINWSASGISVGCNDVACSSNGNIVLAAGSSTSYLKLSTNGGANWSDITSAGSRQWTGVAMSSDGTKMIASGNFQEVYISTDSGNTWTSKTVTNNGNSYSKCSLSENGNKMAVCFRSSNSKAYTSNDGGNTWNDSGLTNNDWTDIKISSDGTTFLLCAYSGYVFKGIEPNITVNTNQGFFKLMQR